MRYLAVPFLAAALTVMAQPPGVVRVGALPDGGFLLNSGWRIHPAGRQIPLGTLPMSSALTRDGKYMLALNGGYDPPSISVIDTSTAREISRTPVPDAWLGMAFSPDERHLWVGGGSKACLYEFSFSTGGELKMVRALPLMEGAPGSRDFIGDVAVSPSGLLYAADVFNNRILVADPKSGKVTAKLQTGRRPYQIVFAPDGKSFFVTSWADGTLYQHETDNGYRMNAVRLGAHPTGVVLSDRKVETAPGEEAPGWTFRLFVAAANTNNVYVVGVNGTNAQLIETINVAASRMQPLGMTPSALALNPAQTRLYVVCSDSNAAAVVNIEDSLSDVEGFVPTGWYPTSAKVWKDGALAVLNGRGGGSRPDKEGKALSLQTGSLSIIPASALARLDDLTQQAIGDSPYRDDLARAALIPPGNPIPPNDETSSPIEHVIYIVRGNRSYDQVLGDAGKGAGDPALTTFGEKVTPNQHKLAREFVLFDNFYSNGDAGADGLNWTMAAIASDYTQKLGPASESGRRRVFDFFDGSEPAAIPPAGYLWTNASARGLSLRNYGNFVTNRPAGETQQVGPVHDGTLDRVTNKNYRGFDLDYPDVERAKAFLADLKSFEETNDMPKLILMRLPNDQTYGGASGKLSPRSLVADNDLALGQIVEAVSHSKFWKSTAIFVVESSAEGGADHIDSHRSPLFVISPYVQRGIVDSTFYNTASVLRTMELILGLRPMTQFDAAATPLWRAFTGNPVLTPYDAAKPEVSLTERNP
jgi:YVTN family beta-propeller protein